MPAGRSGSGGGVKGHRVAKSLQFPNVVTDSALGVGAGGVVLRSEVDEVSVLVGEQGPDDHENGPADGDDGPLLAAASGDPPIPLPEEGVRAAGTDRGLAEDSGQVAVAVPVPAWPFLRPADSLTPGAKRAQEARCAGVGNRAMS